MISVPVERVVACVILGAIDINALPVAGFTLVRSLYTSHKGFDHHHG